MSRGDPAGDADAVLHPLRTPTLFGHAAAEALLLDAYRSERLHHAWLIGGPQGIGKATLAWRMVRFVLAHPDPNQPAVSAATNLSVETDIAAVRRLEAGSNGDVFVLERQWNEKTKKPWSEIRIDDVRQMSGLFQRASAAGGHRICVIDSADDLNRSSANALLKLIEEPPPRSLFLIVSHNPGQVMPTLVSRCRRLILPALTDEHVAQALTGIASRLPNHGPTALADVARRARGSVGEAVRLLGGSALDLDHGLEAILRRLPEVDWTRVHRLADMVGFSDERTTLVVGGILDWLGTSMQDEARSGAPPRRLAEHAAVWDIVRTSAREVEVLNLDKRAFLLSVFADLGRLARTA